MIDLNKTYNELHFEILKNFVFYIPFELIDNEDFYEVIDELEIEITQEMVEKYVNTFQLIDESVNIVEIESNDFVKKLIVEKTLILANNSFELSKLKDLTGNESFNFIFKKYIKVVSAYKKIASLLTENFDRLYPETSKIPKLLMFQQENMLEFHLKEVEELIGINAEKPVIKEVIEQFLTSGIRKKNTEKKSIIEIEIIPFRNFIRHENNVEIEIEIKKHFSDLRGVSLRYLIEFLKEKGLLMVNHGDAQKIYYSIKTLFNNKDIGVYNSIFAKNIFKGEKDDNYKTAKITFEKKLTFD